MGRQTQCGWRLWRPIRLPKRRRSHKWRGCGLSWSLFPVLYFRTCAQRLHTKCSSVFRTYHVPMSNLHVHTNTLVANISTCAREENSISSHSLCNVSQGILIFPSKWVFFHLKWYVEKDPYCTTTPARMCSVTLFDYRVPPYLSHGKTKLFCAFPRHHQKRTSVATDFVSRAQLIGIGGEKPVLVWTKRWSPPKRPHANNANTAIVQSGFRTSE